MNAERWLDHAQTTLLTAGIGTARLDSLVLLEDCLSKNRTHILAHPDLLITKSQQKWLDTRVARRLTHEPLAYIRGRTEFYNRDFFIDKRVLEPRPESETMIDLLKNLRVAKSVLTIDIGTGSGALGITAKLELPRLVVDLIDIDINALAVARKNVRKFGVDVRVHKSDLLPNIQNEYDIVLANLPYVPDNYSINEAAESEPRIAIFGGSDGLDVYRRLFKQVELKAHRPRYILTESLPPQHEKLANIAEASGYRLTITEDFIQLFSPK